MMIKWTLVACILATLTMGTECATFPLPYCSANLSVSPFHASSHNPWLDTAASKEGFTLQLVQRTFPPPFPPFPPPSPTPPSLTRS